MRCARLGRQDLERFSTRRPPKTHAYRASATTSTVASYAAEPLAAADAEAGRTQAAPRSPSAPNDPRGISGTAGWRATSSGSAASQNYSEAHGRRTATATSASSSCGAAERGSRGPDEVTKPHPRALPAAPLPPAQAQRASRSASAASTCPLVPVRAFFKWLTARERAALQPGHRARAAAAGASDCPSTCSPPAKPSRCSTQPDIDDPIGLRDRAILETLYSTGMRRFSQGGNALSTGDQLNFARQEFGLRFGGAFDAYEVSILPGFGDQDAAAAAALRRGNPQSISDNLEYGGYVYEQSGAYDYTVPQRGGPTGFQPSSARHLVPGGGSVVGDYHTHGDYSQIIGGKVVRTTPALDVFNSNHFSGQDLIGIRADAAGIPSYRGYLSTPSGVFRAYDPGSGRIYTIR